MSADTSRKAFEADYLKQMKFETDLCGWFARNSFGQYDHSHMECRWEGWQASRKQALADAEDRVTTLYEGTEPPFLVDICKAILES